MTKYILSTIAWVESIAKKEIEKQGWKIIEVSDRMIEFEGDSKTMIRVNLWSRVWNKVYQVLEEGTRIDDFDKLYDLVAKIDFKKESQNSKFIYECNKNVCCLSDNLKWYHHLLASLNSI